DLRQSTRSGRPKRPKKASTRRGSAAVGPARIAARGVGGSDDESGHFLDPVALQGEHLKGERNVRFLLLHPGAIGPEASSAPAGDVRLLAECLRRLHAVLWEEALRPPEAASTPAGPGR